MNRIRLDLIKQTTSIQIKQLKQITLCHPYTNGWLSQKFPIYPIIINIFIVNPPFNKICIAMMKPYLPKLLVIQGSADSKQYFTFAKITQFEESILILNLEENHHYKYLRLKLFEPQISKRIGVDSNVCNQVGIRGIQLSNVLFYGCEYVCNLGKKLQLDPNLFCYVEMLEYKSLIAKKKSKKSVRSDQLILIARKYEGMIDGVLNRLKKQRQDLSRLSQKARDYLKEQYEILASQPLQIFNAEQIEYDRQGAKNEVNELQGELADFYVHRLNSLHKDVTDYFHKYWNRQVKEEYMRYLSSPDHQDHGKALANFWGQVKGLGEFSPILEQAIVMYFNYFLEYTHDPLKLTAIKILCLLFRNESLSFKPYFCYERVLFNLYSQLFDEERKSLYETSLKCIYTLYKKIPDNLFIQCLLNKQHSVKIRMKILKLEILQRLTFRDLHVDGRDRDIIIEYLLDLLSYKQLSLVDKNRAYNIIAYLASIYGKNVVMQRFEKLNAMLIMSMQKIVDKKLLMIKNPSNGRQQQVISCQHCGLAKASFKDENIYDLHCYKDCKYLTGCKYCNQIVEIPELDKHYIHQCQQRNIFKECSECNQVIVKAKQEEHMGVCSRQLLTKCGLCGEVMENKLKLKAHILKEGCPNNARL